MPTLELPNLQEIARQKRLTPPPITSQTLNQPVGSPSQWQSQQAYCCQPGLNLSVQQGATLSSQIALTVKDANGNTQPVDITGFQFQFTAKIDINLPDTDPSVIEVNWTETVTATQGTTWLVVPSNLTSTMQLVAYFYQVWMVQSPTSPTPIVTPLFSGTLTICQPVSARSS